MLDLIELHDALLDCKLKHAPGSSDNDVGAIVLEKLTVLADGNTAVENGALHVLKIFGEPFVLVMDLESELAGVAENNDANLSCDGF